MLALLSLLMLADNIPITQVTQGTEISAVGLEGLQSIAP